MSDIGLAGVSTTSLNKVGPSGETLPGSAFGGLDAFGGRGPQIGINELGERVKDIDLATVYRTLEILESLDLVEHQHQQHGSGIYYLKRQERSGHIVCNSCNKIEDIPIDIIDSVEKIIANEANFKLIDNHFVYTGLCKKCK